MVHEWEANHIGLMQSALLHINPGLYSVQKWGLTELKLLISHAIVIRQAIDLALRQDCSTTAASPIHMNQKLQGQKQPCKVSRQKQAQGKGR